MEFLFQFSATAIVLMLTLITPFIYSFFWISRKANKKAPPKAAGAWPLIGHLHILGGSQPPHITLGKLADRYGPIFTIKFGVHQALIIITLELLSNHRLEMLSYVRKNEVKEAIGGLYQQWSNNKSSSTKLLVEMKRWFGDVTLNVILKIIVGKRFVEYINSSQRKVSEGWRKSLGDFFELSGIFAVSDGLPFLRWMDLGGVERAMKKTAKELDQVLDLWLEEHKQKRASGITKGEEDFMDVMLSILDDAKQELSNRNADTINKATCLNFELIPFGSGRRMCPGISFALQVLNLTLATLLHGFEMETVNEKPIDMTESKGLTNLKATPLEALLTPRLPAHLY
ncbi:unnamed protein product [Dovyalis caffra]|uniref:Cytochrome P450 n=1 Tax=Dovyalis caffra TaxID=77055 RepID=A0AAV1S8P0_9ROSI|nr:unnamed protein product [Dovyalis caffra]